MSMKNIALALSLLFLFLSVKPCTDGNNIEDIHQDEIGMKHNHQKDNDDSCPITCICDCCGMSIVCEPLSKYEFKFYIKDSIQIITTYKPFYRFDVLSNIWQPPKVIS